MTIVQSWILSTSDAFYFYMHWFILPLIFISARHLVRAMRALLDY